MRLSKTVRFWFRFSLRFWQIVPLLLYSASAWGHAVLLHTEPVANSRTEEPPSNIILTFNERVEPVFNSIKVIDSAGKRVNRGEARLVGERDTIQVDLDALPDGPYAVLWRVNSADGHQVQGSFGFGLRSEPPDKNSLPSLAPTEANAFRGACTTIVKWVDLTALFVWLGSIGFIQWVLVPSILGITKWRDDALPKAAIRSSLKLLWLAPAILFAAEVLGFVGQASTLADVPFQQALSYPVLSTVLLETNYGMWWAIRIGAALALLGVCFSPFRSADGLIEHRAGANFRIISTSLLTALILLTIPMAGHASSVSEWMPLAVVMDWTHLATTAIWIGGLVPFVAVVLILRKHGNEPVELLREITGRFSRTAKICVSLLIVTGIYNAWLHMPGWGAFITTSYGQVLLSKLLLAIAIFWIAAINLRRVLPALASHEVRPEEARKWAARFGSLLQTETVLGIILLGLVALLTSLPPATAAVTAGPMDLTQQSGNMTVGLKLDPNKVGGNRAVISLASNGQKIATARRVTVYLRSLDMDMGLTTVQAKPTDDGNYEADVVLSMAGKWLLSVEVSPPQGDTFVTEFKISSSL